MAVRLFAVACVSSPYVCALHGVCWKGNKALVVMDLHKLTLESYVREHHPHGMPHDQAVTVVLELACALQALHTRAKSMHLDVKPANVLLTESLSVRLCDFGILKSIRTNAASQTTRVRPGTIGCGLTNCLFQRC